MGQNIKLRIGQKDFALVANSAEQERKLRLASEDVNKVLAQYHAKFANQTLEDKLAFVALNQAMCKLTLSESLEQVKSEADSLEALLKNYLNETK